MTQGWPKLRDGWFYGTVMSVLLAIGAGSLAGCTGGGASASAAPSTFGASPDNVRVYRQDSPYRSVLKPCVFVDTVEAACTLATLPFISPDGGIPSVDAIMQRLLVSHDWMARRFEQVLRAAPPDLLRMFGATTAVLIGSEVRPSFYYALNAAIQLDPYVLWQTVEEKRTVSTVEDFRTDFGRQLGFDDFQRAVIDGQRAVKSFSLLDDSERGFDDILVPVMQLLFHELTHAIDAMPLNQIAGLDPALKAFEAIVQVDPYSLSRRLLDAMPLGSEGMTALADVRYRGSDASPDQQQLTAADVGGLFAGDAAMKFYSYLSVREDVATLVESALMKIHYNVELNIAFVDKPADPATADCSEYLVGWGVRNRLADPLVAARARFLLEAGLGTRIDMARLSSDALGVTAPMAVGVDWCTNNLPATELASRRRSPADDDWRSDRYPASDRMRGLVWH